MPLTIDSVNLLNRYANGVVARADHHAGNVNEVLLSLLGAVIWRAGDNLEVRTHAGSPANMLWLQVGENRYVLAYNHDRNMIELRNSNRDGEVIESFDNNTMTSRVKEIFANL